MGEYATYNGGQIKIGTCEDMYYLRYDQRGLVTPESGSVNPAGSDKYELRFRFPWPGEDQIEPGGFKEYGKAVQVRDLKAAEDVDHNSVQFVAQAGYLVSLPCPESGAYKDAAGLYSGRSLTGTTVRVARNGFQGSVLLSAQKPVKGVGLVPILRCGGCGAMWREEDRTEIERIAVCFRSQADERERQDRAVPASRHHGVSESVKFYHTIADRVLAGLQERT